MTTEEINRMKGEISVLKDEIAEAQDQIFFNLYQGVRAYVGEGNRKTIGDFVAYVLPNSGKEGLLLSPAVKDGKILVPENPTEDKSLPEGFFIAEDYGDDVLEDLFTLIYGE